MDPGKQHARWLARMVKVDARLDRTDREIAETLTLARIVLKATANLRRLSDARSNIWMVKAPDVR